MTKSAADCAATLGQIHLLTSKCNKIAAKNVVKTASILAIIATAIIVTVSKYSAAAVSVMDSDNVLILNNYQIY